MVSKEVKVINATGLHLKPAAVFSGEACRYESVVTFTFGDYTANAKSVLSVLAGCVKQGDTIEIVCSGKDEEAALQGMCRVVESGLGEEIV